MSILNFLNRFITREPESTYNICEQTLRKMGYKKNGDDSFLRENSSGRTMVWLSESGAKIKVYGGGYGESDFLPAPLDDIEKFKKFIRENEL